MLIRIISTPNHCDYLWDVEFPQRGSLALLAAIGDAPINALMSDGFAESMNFSRMEAISTLLADDLLQHD